MAQDVSRRGFAIGMGTATCMTMTNGVALAGEAAGGAFWMPTTWDRESDIVIVGFGAAGANAGIAAIKAGVEPLILEAAPRELRGGNSGVCGGGWICPTDVDAYAEFLYRLNLCVDDKDELREFAESLSGMCDWMDELEIDWMDTHRTGFNFYPKSFPEMADTMNNSMRGVAETGMEHHAMADADGNQAMGGKYFYEPMASTYEGLGGEVLYETRGLELVQNLQTGEILGVKAEDSSGSIMYIKARRGVILACGGYEANHEYTDNYVLPNMNIGVTGGPYNRGDGVRMAAHAGAKLRHMSCYEWQGYGIRLFPNDPVMSMVTTSTNWHTENRIIMVNKYGKRFYREDKRMGHTRTFPGTEFDGYADSTDTINDYAGAPAFAIFDQARFEEGPGNFYGGADKLAMGWFGQHDLYKWSDDNSAELASGIIVQADTLEELANRLGFVDADVFADTVTRYNGFVDAGTDEDFGRDPASMVKIETAPFYAIEVWPSLLNTQGGPVRKSLTSRVLDEEGNEIPRLYSAGELGSRFGLVYHGSGNTTEACMSGKIAAEDAATLDPWE